jgi:hypothetical protein
MGGLSRASGLAFGVGVRVRVRVRSALGTGATIDFP